jgi:hypothetical protein
MPSNQLGNRTIWETDYYEIIATDRGLRSPRAITIDPSYIQPSAAGSKIIYPGMILSKLSSGYGRIFPASRATVATTTGQNTITVRRGSIFKVGDVLRNGFSGAAIGTILSIAGNVITLTANAASAVAIGDIINVSGVGEGGALADALGIVVSAVDVLKFPNDVAAYTSGSFYGVRMPFWDAALSAQFPEMTFFPYQNSFPVT